MEKYLTKKEKISEVRVGDKVLTLTEWSGINAGTKGEVVEMRKSAESISGIIVVEWSIDWKARGLLRPLQDGFNERELKYLMFLDL